MCIYFKIKQRLFSPWKLRISCVLSSLSDSLANFRRAWLCNWFSWHVKRRNKQMRISSCIKPRVCWIPHMLHTTYVPREVWICPIKFTGDREMTDGHREHLTRDARCYPECWWETTYQDHLFQSDCFAPVEHAAAVQLLIFSLHITEISPRQREGQNSCENIWGST